jgi:predicted NAD/FAD-binding protein
MCAVQMPGPPSPHPVRAPLGPRDEARTPPLRLRIAVVGSGAAGLSAALGLDRRHDVTVFETERRAGGHVHTITLERGPDAGTPVDTGFIVMNESNYPQLTRLLKQLGVETQESCMSFAYQCRRSGVHYAGTGLDGLFSRRAHLFSPAFHGMIADWIRFNRRARRDLDTGHTRALTLAEYLADVRPSRAFVERYLLPLGAAIWSAPAETIETFPAEAFLRFFDNHGLLSVRQPRWRTVSGGSHTYVRALLSRLRGAVRGGAPVTGVARREDHVTVRTAGGAERFDHVVIATHADQALRLLEDPTADERRLLGAWTYSTNHAVLHTDTALLPSRRRAWASWNYTAPVAPRAGSPVHVTYYMNRLQRLATRGDYCVTLNAGGSIREEHVVREMTYAHPVYDRVSMASQRELPDLNGRCRTYYCGSYFGFGFHEDAVRSGLEVARALGGGW